VRKYAGGLKDADAAYGKPHINVCTIGHVDHGKTTLTSAITLYLAQQGKAKPITYEEIDKAPEEVRRGITINTAHVQYRTDKRHYAHIDNPGHREFIKNMITGTALTDAAILVVDVSLGPMPQTREHMILANLCGVSQVIIFLNKMDLCTDEDLADLVEAELREMLEGYNFAPDRIYAVRGNALTAMKGDDYTTVIQMLQALDNLKDPDRPIEKGFLMPIEDLHIVEGRGVVATGVVTQGKAEQGDQLEIFGFKVEPKPIKCSIIAIETFHQVINSCKAGDSVGLLLRGPGRTELRRGMVIAKQKSLPVYRHFRSTVYIHTPDEGGRVKGFGNGYCPQFFVRTGTVTGQISIVGLGDEPMLNPGETGILDTVLIWPCNIYVGMKFFVREGGMSIASGIIMEILPEGPDYRKRREKELVGERIEVEKRKAEQAKKEADAAAKNKQQQIDAMKGK